MSATVQVLRKLPWHWGEPLAGPAVPEWDDDGADVRVATRALSAAASPDHLFLWLCQLRRAPYSYDLIDNFGRPSPRWSDPAMTDLRVGQTFMTIFTLAAFTPGRSISIRMKPGIPTALFGQITVHYTLTPVTENRTQLSAALVMPPIGRRLTGLKRYLLAWGDLIMMRKQLSVLRSLAESEPFRRPEAAASHTD